MKFIRLMLISIFFIALEGCASWRAPTVYALPGTNTAIVGISLDKSGMPYEKNGAIRVYPGQKVVYAGPNEFAIKFKNQKTPNGIVENRSTNGIAVIEIPADLDDAKKYPQFAEEFSKNGEVVFNYGVRAGDKEIDPPLVIMKRV